MSVNVVNKSQNNSIIKEVDQLMAQTLGNGFGPLSPAKDKGNLFTTMEVSDTEEISPALIKFNEKVAKDDKQNFRMTKL